jgi:hypothetical protein
MRAVEEIPTWDKFIHPLASALNFAFGCRHRHLSRVFTIRGKTYKVCCDCGAHLPYSLDRMAVVHRRAASGRVLRRALRRLHLRHV